MIQQQTNILEIKNRIGKVGDRFSAFPFLFRSGLCRSAHHRRNPGMFKGDWGASPTSEKRLGIYPDTARTEYAPKYAGKEFEKTQSCRTQIEIEIVKPL